MNDNKNKKFKDMTKKEKAFFLIKFILSIICFVFLLVCLIFTMNTRCLAVKADTIEPNPPGNGIEVAGPLASADMWTVDGSYNNLTFTSALPGLAERLGLGDSLNYYAAVNSEPQTISALPNGSLTDGLQYDTVGQSMYVNALFDFMASLFGVYLVDSSSIPSGIGYSPYAGVYSHVFNSHILYLNSNISSKQFTSKLAVELSPNEFMAAWVGNNIEDVHFVLTDLGLNSPPGSPFDFSNARITIYLSGFDLTSELGFWAARFLSGPSAGALNLTSSTSVFCYSYGQHDRSHIYNSYFICPSAVFEYDVWNDTRTQSFHVYISLTPFITWRYFGGTLRSGEALSLSSFDDTPFLNALGLPPLYSNITYKISPTLGDTPQFTVDGYPGSFTAVTFNSPTFVKNNFTGVPDATQWVTDLPVTATWSSNMTFFNHSEYNESVKVAKNLSSFMFGLFLAPFRYVTNFNGILYVDGYIDVDLESSGVGNVSSVYQWFQPFFDSNWFGFTWIALLTVIVGVAAIRALLSFFAGG